MMARDRSYQSTPHSRHDALTAFGSRTDVGCLRDHNEDSLVVAPPLFAIADGMGGHAAGEVASEIAVDVLSKHAPRHPDAEALGRAVEEANRAIIQAAQEGRGREGMGTTMTAALLEGERLVIAQVGDSRAYLLHQGKLQQITRDHSLMADMIEAGQLTPEEARIHPNRSVITRALGSDPFVQPDLYEINVETGDRLLVCSDGLSSMIRDNKIESTLARIRDPQRCASQLVNEAISAGGHDNVTVIVVDVAGFREKRLKTLALKTKLTIVLVLVLFAVIIGGAAWGVSTYLDTAAYLVNDNGKVSIYRGVPGDLFGLTFSRLERETDVDVDDLQPGVANRLSNGIRVDDVAAADALIEEYRQEIERTKRDSDTDSESDRGDALQSPDANSPSTDDADSASNLPSSGSQE